MSIESIIATAYFVVGLILMFYWWNKEYNEVANDEEGSEEPIVILFMWALVVLWPFKLAKNYFEDVFEL